jgi:hypothetical protein
LISPIAAGFCISGFGDATIQVGLVIGPTGAPVVPSPRRWRVVPDGVFTACQHRSIHEAAFTHLVADLTDLASPARAGNHR